jgi:HAD superfamily hydrolase (TIGR01509 family)
MTILYIFDFDDTLIDSEASIRITHDNGSKSVMSSEDYAKYTASPGDEFDFTDFDAYPKNPEIIEPVFAELRSAIIAAGKKSVVILTARSNPVPVRLFLSENNIPDIDIETTGTSDPNAKARFILDKVKSESYEEVIVFEDNVRNIRTIRKVLTQEGIRLKTNRVRNGKIVSTKTENRKGYNTL